MASSEISIRSNFAAINAALYQDEEVAQLIIKAEDPNYQYSKVEHMRLRALFTQLVNLWLSVEAAYENGMASKASFNIIFDDVTQATTSFPATKTIFLEIVEIYPSHDKTKLFQVLRRC
jgi:hypothetical protein